MWPELPPLFVDPDAVPPTPPYEGLGTKVRYALLVGQDPAAVSAGFEFPIMKCTADGFLVTHRPPNSQVTFSKRTPHSTSQVQRLDIGFLGANRDMLHVFNESSDWLVVVLSPFQPAPDRSSVTTIVRPWAEWRMPDSSPLYGGPVWGYWIANPAGSLVGPPPPVFTGFAHCTELT